MGGFTIGVSFEGSIQHFGAEAFDVVMYVRRDNPDDDKVVVFQSKRLHANTEPPPPMSKWSGTALGVKVEDGLARAAFGARLDYTTTSLFSEIDVDEIANAGKPGGATQPKAINLAESLGLPVYYLLYAPPRITGLGFIGTRVVPSPLMHSFLAPVTVNPSASPATIAPSVGAIMSLRPPTIESFMNGVLQCPYAVRANGLGVEAHEMLANARTYVSMTASQDLVQENQHQNEGPFYEGGFYEGPLDDGPFDEPRE